MRPQHRREAEGAVVLRVCLAADPEKAQVEKPYRAGEHALATKTLAGKAPVRVRPQRPEGPGEIEHALELLTIAPAAPGVMVEVLPPAGRVGAGCLEVPERVGADPDVRPRRRDRQRADPFELGPIADQAPIVPAVLETPAAAAARDSRLRAIATAQARHCFRRIPRLPAWRNSLSQSLGGHFEVGDEVCECPTAPAGRAKCERASHGLGHVASRLTRREAVAIAAPATFRATPTVGKKRLVRLSALNQATGEAR